MFEKSRRGWLFVFLAGVLGIVCLMASCDDFVDDCFNTHEADNSEADLVFSDTTENDWISESTDELTSDSIEDDKQEHKFTIIMNEIVYPMDFDSVEFCVRCNQPGVAFELSPQYYVYRLDGDNEVLVGFSGLEVLFECQPVDENDYADIPMSFTRHSLMMEDEFIEGTYRIYHVDDSKVYAEFELRDE